jgi:hypothetical protein
MRVKRSIDRPIRKGLATEERWLGSDAGIIASWERGREVSLESSADSRELTARARNGELVILPWKGGVERALKTQKFGTLRYLGMWHGLRGDDLEIDPDEETERSCTATGMTVVYTSDAEKFTGSDSDS